MRMIKLLGYFLYLFYQNALNMHYFNRKYHKIYIVAYMDDRYYTNHDSTYCSN